MFFISRLFRCWLHASSFIHVGADNRETRVGERRQALAPAVERELAAKFGGHNALEIFGYTREKTPVVIELLGAVSNLEAILFADKFVISGPAHKRKAWAH